MIMTGLLPFFALGCLAVQIVEGGTTTTTTTPRRVVEVTSIGRDGPNERMERVMTVSRITANNHGQRRPNAADQTTATTSRNWRAYGKAAGRELEDGSDAQLDDGDEYRGYDFNDDYYRAYFDNAVINNDGDDDASNWCSPDGAHKHYGQNYHLHQGSFQSAFGGYMCSCASMDNQMMEFECTSCVVCDGPICTMRNVSLHTEYTDRDHGDDDFKDVSQTLSVCTKFVNDFKPFRDVEICGIVQSPNTIANDDSLNDTTVNYSVNGILCASTERIACKGTGGADTGFLIDCSNVGYRQVMNTCNGNGLTGLTGLTGPWSYLYQLSNKYKKDRMKVNPFLTIGVSFTYTRFTNDCPRYDSVVIIESPRGSWLVPQVALFVSILSIGSLYRTLS